MPFCLGVCKVPGPPGPFTGPGNLVRVLMCTMGMEPATDVKIDLFKTTLFLLCGVTFLQTLGSIFDLLSC